ncbi:MAG: hypothetical protein ACP5HM_11125 [Anaerolineae bacterium]
MSGTALETRNAEAPDVQRTAPPDAQRPTVIDVEARPLTRKGSAPTAQLIERGLALLASLMRLALLWVQNREEHVQRITPTQQTLTTPTSTPAGRRSSSSRCGGQRQRRRHRGRTNT